MVKVSVKWQKDTFDVDVDPAADGLTFKAQLYALTNVPPDRQKISGVKGGLLKDDARLSDLGLKDGQKLLMIGSADAAPAFDASSAAAVTFVEDLGPNAVPLDTVNGVLPPGLVNLGNTCYLNASLQCLNAIEPLRLSLQNPNPNPNANPNSNPNLLKQLASLFGDLSRGSARVNPFFFLNAFREAFPQFQQRSQSHPAAYAQQDAEEAFSQLLSAMQQARSSHVLEGELRVEYKCTEAPEEVDVRVEPFVKLQCHISQQTNDLLTGLKLAFSDQMEKQSAVLQRNAVFTKTSRIQRLPEYLVVHYVRFYWRRDTQQKAKVLRQVQFGMTLDVFDLCVPELQAQLREARRIKLERADAEAAGTATTTSSTSSDDTKALATQDGVYELRAVLTHLGVEADSGHYVAWVKDVSGDRWIKYDDDKVTVVPESEIAKLAGGGQWHTAYIQVWGPKSQQ
jgi:ubiquitin carboxyl-terminal hydrolase 14